MIKITAKRELYPMHSIKPLLYKEDLLQIYTLGYGKEQLQLRLSQHLQVDSITYDASQARKVKDPIAFTLEHPIGSQTLRNIAQGKKSAVILISDRTRLSPSHLFLKPMIQQLQAAGLEDIKIIVALGMHRKQTPQELSELAGREIYEQFQVLNHSALPKDCVHIGTTSQGTPVEINRHVVEADLRIATGNIEPHRLVGMSGGVKALIPGCASSRCIEHNHSLSQKYDVVPGNPNNPIHQDLEEVLQFISIEYLFNVIVDHRREIIEAVSGHILLAHKEGMERAKKCFMTPVSTTYDLVVASTGGYPKDMQLYQAAKTLQNAAAVTKPGGSIILIAKCEELFGNGIFQYWVETIQDPNEIENRLKEQFVLGAHKIEHIHAVTKKHKVYMYTDIPEPLIELLGIQPIQELQTTVDQLTLSLDRIAVLPYGAITFPEMVPVNLVSN
jgi:nickel-dependent lactate racemase